MVNVAWFCIPKSNYIPSNPKKKMQQIKVMEEYCRNIVHENTYHHIARMPLVEYRDVAI